MHKIPKFTSSYGAFMVHGTILQILGLKLWYRRSMSFLQESSHFYKVWGVLQFWATPQMWAENSVFDTLSSRKWIDFLRSNYHLHHLHHLHHLQAHLHVSFLTSDSKTFRSFCASSERFRPRNLRHDVAWGFCFAATKDWKVTFCNQNARKIGLTKSCIIEDAWNLQKHDLFSRISHHLNPFHQQHGAASSLRAEAHESSQDD